MLYVDTNIIIVYLTNMPPEHGGLSRDFFRDLAYGSTTAKTTEGVLVEATQVLVSSKGLAFPREQISKELKQILSFRGMRIDNLELHLRALDRFGATNLDYVDCTLIEFALERDDAVVSFDRDFDRVRPGIRMEPPFGRQDDSTQESLPGHDQEIKESS